MSEEEKDLLNQEIPEEDAEELDEEDGVEEEDNESPDGDSTVDDDEEEEQDGEESEEDFWESEAEYLKAKGIEDAESLDEVLERYAKERGTYQTKSQQFEQLDTLLKSKGFANGVGDLLTGQVFNQPQAPATNEQQESYFSNNPFSQAFKEFEENITDENTKKFYNQFNKFADKAITPSFKKIEDMYTKVISSVIENQKAISDMRWATFNSPGKDLVSKDKFLQAMESYGITDPEKVMNLLALNDPKLLEQIQKKGVEKGKKQFKKFKKKGMKRGKQGTRNEGWKKYFSSDLTQVNKEMLDSLDSDTQVKYLELAEKALKKRTG